jgi:hypothetical protein
MGEVIQFPAPKKPNQGEVINEPSNPLEESHVLEFKKGLGLSVRGKSVQACLLQGSQNFAVGSEIVLEVFGKKYQAILTSIVERDTNNNITKIAYSVPFLNGDDPLKFGEADFTYRTENI